VLATVLFTDIVRSTDIAVELGDARWNELLRRHHVVIRRELKRFGGREIDNAGDGFFAIFDSPAGAVLCADACVDGSRALGVEIRAGLHIGEIEFEGTNVRGVAVHLGARVMATAGAGETMVTGTLHDVVSGSGLGFEDRGMHELKGVPGTWQLWLCRRSMAGASRRRHVRTMPRSSERRSSHRNARGVERWSSAALPGSWSLRVWRSSCCPVAEITIRVRAGRRPGRGPGT
jgi:class 3 adenylate cyclase